jgi:hypothetical protein
MQLNLTAPRSWQELTPKQLLYLSWLLTQNDFSVTSLHCLAFVRLTGIRILGESEDGWLCRYGRRIFTLSAEQSASFSKQFAWITSPSGEVTPPYLMAKMTHVDTRLNMTPLKQYLSLENYYQAFIFTHDEYHLSCLCAAFYTGGMKFNDNRTAERSKAFAPLPLHVRYTVFLWYYHLKGVLEEFFPHFLERAKTILEDEAPSFPNMRLVIDNMIRALTGGDVTKAEAVYMTDTWTALAELDAKALEYKEYEKRMNKLKHRK